MAKKIQLNKKWRHPEAEKDEIYLGNSSNKVYKTIKWRTKRKGNVPYNILNNQPLKTDILFPVFIKKDEWEEYTYGKDFSEIKIEGSKKYKLRKD